mmetsp:Transcript_9759/g.15023  ORF Transcript_9759/g.15023 Transcript_9759/m.15023 type:complete len:197 (+) Transcript_9759:132-722(+)
MGKRRINQVTLVEPLTPEKSPVKRRRLPERSWDESQDEILAQALLNLSGCSDKVRSHDSSKKLDGIVIKQNGVCATVSDDESDSDDDDSCTTDDNRVATSKRDFYMVSFIAGVECPQSKTVGNCEPPTKFPSPPSGNPLPAAPRLYREDSAVIINERRALHMPGSPQILFKPYFPNDFHTGMTNHRLLGLAGLQYH